MGKTFISGRPQFRYINYLFGLRCFKDLLDWELFPNAKEFTETIGAFKATQQHLPHISKDDPTVTCVVVGDGNTPRTAAFFAVMTKWNCISVDPMLKADKIPYWESKIQRLKCYKDKIENLTIHNTNVVIVSVHSHATDKNILNAIKGINYTAVVSMPCCIKQPYNGNPDFSFKDNAIWSGQTKIDIWRNLNAMESKA